MSPDELQIFPNLKTSCVVILDVSHIAYQHKFLVVVVLYYFVYVWPRAFCCMNYNKPLVVINICKGADYGTYLSQSWHLYKATFFYHVITFYMPPDHPTMQCNFRLTVLFAKRSIDLMVIISWIVPNTSFEQISPAD